MEIIRETITIRIAKLTEILKKETAILESKRAIFKRSNRCALLYSDFRRVEWITGLIETNQDVLAVFSE